MDGLKFELIAEKLSKIYLKIEITVPGSRPSVMSFLTIQELYSFV